MSVTATTGIGLADLLRDTRHLGARAASDLADWLAYLAVEGKSDRTLYAYMRWVAGLLNEYPDTPFERFTAAQITQHLALKPPRSRHIPRSVLNRWFEWGASVDVEDELPDGTIVTRKRLSRNPMLGGNVPKMRQPHRRPKDIYSDAEMALLEALPIHDGALWTLLFNTGLRVSEAISLQWRHVDLNRAKLMVLHGKGDKDRICGLGPETLTALVDLERLESLNPDDHLWYKRAGKRRLRRDRISDTTFRDRWYARTLREAGVRYLNPHQTRHTYGHRLRELGFDLEERKVAMGHNSIKTTEFYYGRVTVEDVAAKIAGTVGL